MKKVVPLFVLLAVIASALISSPKSANGQSAGLVSSVLNRMERNRQSLKSLKASLSMEKYNSQLRDKDSYSGWVLYVPSSGRDASVRIEWQKPQHEILAVSNQVHFVSPASEHCDRWEIRVRERKRSGWWRARDDVYDETAARSEISTSAGCP